MRPQIVKNIFLFTAHFFVYGVAIAQQKAPPPPQRTPPPAPGLPLDDGILLLLVAGLIFGLYLILKSNKLNLQSR